MDPLKARILLITDSRGRGMNHILNRTRYSVRVISYPGNGIKNSVQRSVNFIKFWQPHLITLAGSICDVTVRDSQTKIICMRHDTIDDSVRHYMNEIEAACDIIKETTANTHIQLTTVIGMDLTDANNQNYVHLRGQELENYRTNKLLHNDQQRLNLTILTINKEIVLANLGKGIPTAWTANTVHAYKHGKTLHRYTKLIDGCHFSENLKEEWIKILCSSYDKMNRIDFHY